MPHDQVRWHVLFSGKVQQVGFRYTAHLLARKLSLSGWVDNLSDGRVEMEAQGKISDLRKLIIQLKSQPHIHIQHIEITEIPCQKQSILPLSHPFFMHRPNE